MTTQPPSQQPPPNPPPPEPEPGPGASRDEWREWRRRNRDYMRANWMHGFYGPWGWGWSGGWSWFWGAALVVIGGYYLLANLGLLNWLRGDVLWPLLLILLGVAILVNRYRGGSR